MKSIIQTVFTLVWWFTIPLTIMPATNKINPVHINSLILGTPPQSNDYPIMSTIDEARVDLSENVKSRGTSYSRDQHSHLANKPESSYHSLTSDRFTPFMRPVRTSRNRKFRNRKSKKDKKIRNQKGFKNKRHWTTKGKNGTSTFLGDKLIDYTLNSLDVLKQPSSIYSFNRLIQPDHVSGIKRKRNRLKFHDSTSNYPVYYPNAISQIQKDGWWNYFRDSFIPVVEGGTNLISNFTGKISTKPTMTILGDDKRGKGKQYNPNPNINHRSKQNKNKLNGGKVKIFGNGAVPTKKRPNIILTLTDDQDVELGSLNYMPILNKIFVKGGARFNNAFVTTPVCCPSRSSILTGLYSHNHHVLTNNQNCSSPMWQRMFEPETFGAQLFNAGYRTGYFGKYLNEYNGSYIPPGWKVWSGLIRNTRYYNYTINHNGRKIKHGDFYAEDYFSDLIANDSIAFLRNNKVYHTDKSFLLVMSMPAPHGTEDSAPQFSGMFENVTSHRTPSWNYAPNMDKEWILQRTGKMEPIHIQFTDMLHRKRLQTLQSVDNALKRIYKELDELNELENTYWIYTSDHGYHLGQYGLVKGKSLPYEFDIKVPFFIRGPGIDAGTTIPQIALNIDIAPTILDMAEIKIPVNKMDGKSLLPLTRELKPKNWRQTFLIERGKITDRLLRRIEIAQSQKLGLNHGSNNTTDDSYELGILSKSQWIDETCNKIENSVPCKRNQKWYCKQDPNNRFKWRLFKCRYYGELINGQCYCFPSSKYHSASSPTKSLERHTPLIPAEERALQRKFLAKHVKSTDYKPNFMFESQYYNERNTIQPNTRQNLELVHAVVTDDYELPVTDFMDLHENTAKNVIPGLKSGGGGKNKFSVNSDDADALEDVSGDFSRIWNNLKSGHNYFQHLTTTAVTIKRNKRYLKGTINNDTLMNSYVNVALPITKDVLNNDSLTYDGFADIFELVTQCILTRRLRRLKMKANSTAKGKRSAKRCQVLPNNEVQCNSPQNFSTTQYDLGNKFTELTEVINLYRKCLNELKNIRNVLKKHQMNVPTTPTKNLNRLFTNQHPRKLINSTYETPLLNSRPRVTQSFDSDKSEHCDCSFFNDMNSDYSKKLTKSMRPFIVEEELGDYNHNNYLGTIFHGNQSSTASRNKNELAFNSNSNSYYGRHKLRNFKDKFIHPRLKRQPSSTTRWFNKYKRLNSSRRSSTAKPNRKKTVKHRASCSEKMMNCFQHDNDHWKTPPLWNQGPFCFCQNANNQSFNCMRTINSTHNNLYCEFVTGFISYYDINKDPFQLTNIVHSLTIAQHHSLHDSLLRLKSCRGNDCTILSKHSPQGKTHKPMQMIENRFH